MNLRIKPDRLQLSPQAANATSAFDHWLACFESYLRTSTEESSDSPKLQVLYSRVSPGIFPLIRDVLTYSEAMELMKGHYVRPVNQLYSRHLLSTKQQLPGESLDDFWRALHILGRNCDCQAVSAVHRTELLIRDAFVMGMGSAYVHQRLLERGTLDLAGTRQLANLLTVASRNIQSYASWASWVTPATDSSSPQACAARQPANSGGPKCYFCGRTNTPGSAAQRGAQPATDVERRNTLFLCARPGRSPLYLGPAFLDPPHVRPRCAAIFLLASHVRPVDATIFFSTGRMRSVGTAIFNAARHVRPVGAAIFGAILDGASGPLLVWPFIACRYPHHRCPAGGLPASAADRLDHPGPVPAPQPRDLNDNGENRWAQDVLPF
ncbi:uncharacterized protein [Scyliorhinus torazame]|uniref:uncharacterized protein n=1 Tax=Scyliorhinus torazame TaxID=75743 RepID=UPI003B591127